MKDRTQIGNDKNTAGCQYWTDENIEHSQVLTGGLVAH